MSTMSKIMYGVLGAFGLAAPIMEGISWLHNHANTPGPEAWICPVVGAVLIVVIEVMNKKQGVQ